VEETVESTVKLNLTETESSYWRNYDKDGTELANCGVAAAFSSSIAIIHSPEPTYFSITIHWIDSSYTCRFAVLSVSPLPEHTRAKRLLARFGRLSTSSIFHWKDVSSCCATPPAA